MSELEMMIVVKDDEMKAAAEEDMRELIDAGTAQVMTFDSLGEFLVKIMTPALDRLQKNIDTVAAIIKKKSGEPEPEAEEEIPTPDIGDAIAQAALKTWHEEGVTSQTQTPGPRKRVVKPDPPGLVTNEPLEYIEPPDPDSKGIIKAARRTWHKGRGLFGGK